MEEKIGEVSPSREFHGGGEKYLDGSEGGGPSCHMLSIGGVRKGVGPIGSGVGLGKVVPRCPPLIWNVPNGGCRV